MDFHPHLTGNAFHCTSHYRYPCKTHSQNTFSSQERNPLYSVDHSKTIILVTSPEWTPIHHSDISHVCWRKCLLANYELSDVTVALQ